MISGWWIKQNKCRLPALVDTNQQPRPNKRRQYSEALKRQMVAETQAPEFGVDRGATS